MTAAKMIEKLADREFGMTLNEFMTQKIIEESLYDHEIGRLLGVAPNIIGRVRRGLKLKRKNGFSRRFEQRYGQGAVTTFKTMIEKRSVSLSGVGRYFGFSREYARQVFQKIYGRPYTLLHKQKLMANRLEREEAAGQASKQNEALSALCRRLRCMGLNSRVLKRGRALRIDMNGYVIDLKMTSKPVTIGGRRRFRITLNDCPGRGEVDFFICILKGDNGKMHYVIPGRVMPKSGVTLSPDGIPGRSKYAPFKEAWHLLETHEQAAARAA